MGQIHAPGFGGKKPIVSRPPILYPPNPPPQTVERGKALAVIVSVNNPTAPTFATVAVNDHFPFESGFSVPMGAGPFAQGFGAGTPQPINSTSTSPVNATGFPVTVTCTNVTNIQGGNVSTEFNANITAGPTAQTVTPTFGTAMTGIKSGMTLVVGSSGTIESVVVTATTKTTFKAIFTNNHSTGDPIISEGSNVLFDSTGSHPEIVTASNVQGGGSPQFTATFAYTHNSGVNITNSQSDPLGFFYFYNNAQGVGGSICWVDLDTKQILSFTGYTSTIAPTPYYQQMQTHRHNGNYDPSGYQNPGPINISYPETFGNLPYWQNTLVLQGVVDSDGNVISVDFNAGMLKKITAGQMAGYYEAIANPIEDNVAFLLEAGQWLWVQWKLSFKTAPATTYCGPTFIDINANVIQVRFEAPGGGQGPVSTTFPTGISAGSGVTVTPTSGTGMTNITSGSILTVGNGQDQEIITVSGIGGGGTNFTANYQNNHTAKEAIVAHGFGHIYCNGTQVALSKFGVDNNLNQLLGQDLYSNWSVLHTMDIGVQYVGGTQYRVVVQYYPNAACDSRTLLDLTFDSSIYTTGQMLPPILPGFTADNLTDAGDMYFKDFEYRTTKINGGGTGNPYPNVPPALLTGFTTLYTLYQQPQPGGTTFDVIMEFDVDVYGHIPKMSDWGGQIVLLATQHGQTNWGQYGFFQPVQTGTHYNDPTFFGVGNNPPLVAYSGLGVGSQWDLAIAYVDQLNNMTPVTFMGTVTPAGLQIGSGNIIINPNLSSPVVDASSSYSLGPSFSSIVSDLEVTLILDAQAGHSYCAPYSPDYTKIAFFYRPYKISGPNPWTTAGEIDLIPNGGNTAWLFGGGNPYQFIYVSLANEYTYDFGFAFSGASGYSPIVHPSAFADITNETILVHGKYMDNGNPVPSPTFDGTFAIVLANTISDNTLTCAADTQFKLNNQPTDGTLSRIGLYTSAFSFNNQKFAKLAIQAEQMSSHAGQRPPVAATGTYDMTINDLNNGIFYAFWTTYISNSGRETQLPNVFSYGYNNAGFTNGINSGTSQFYYNGNSGPYSTNGVSANIVAGSILVIDPASTIGTEPFYQSEIVTVASGYAGGGANPIPIVGTFAYNHAAGVPVISGAGYIATLDASNVVIPPGSIAQMPATIDVDATAVSAYQYSGGGEGSYHASFNVTPVLTGISGSPFNTWGQGFAVFVLVNDSGSVEYNRPLSDYSLSTIFSTATWIPGQQISVTTGSLSVTHDYQIAIAAMDQQGNFSGSIGYNPPGGGDGNGLGVCSKITVSQYAPQDNPNLVADSDFNFCMYRTSPTGPFHNGFNNSEANLEIYYATYRVIDYIGDPSSGCYWYYDHSDEGGNAFAVGPNTNNTINNYQAMGEPMTLKGGSTYCISCYINATTCSDGGNGLSPSMGLVSHQTGSTLSQASTAGTSTLHVYAVNGACPFNANDFITIYDPNPGGHPQNEAQKVIGVSGTGPYTLTVFKKLLFNHAKNTPVYLNWNAGPGGNQNQVIAEVTAPFGTKGRISLIFTPLSDTICSILLQSHKCKVNSEHLIFTGPMCQLGDYAGPYKSGPPLKGGSPQVMLQGLFDYDTGPADPTTLQLNTLGTGAGFYLDNRGHSPQVQNTHNQDFSLNIPVRNYLANPDFIIGGGTTGITGNATGTVPKYYGVYNPGNMTVAYAYDAGQVCPVGNGGSWKMTYNANTSSIGLTVGANDNYSGFVLKANNTYTFSFYALSNSALEVDWQVLADAGVTVSNFDISTYWYPTSTFDTNWHRFAYTIVVGATDFTGNLYPSVTSTIGSSYSLWIGGLKLEEGLVPTTWLGPTYASGMTDFVLPHPNKNIDYISDGPITYGRTKLTGLTSGIVSTTCNTFFGTSINENSDGSMTGFLSSGTASVQSYTIKSNHIIQIEGQLQLASTSTNDLYILLGNQTNGYGLEWMHGSISGGVYVVKWVAGVKTNLGTLASSIIYDTNFHSFSIIITQGASNLIEASFDNGEVSTLYSDSSLTLTTGTWPITIYDPNNGTTKFWNFTTSGAYPNYSEMHASTKSVIGFNGQLNVNPAGGVTGNLPYSNVPTAVSSVITSGGALVANIVVSGSISAGAVTTAALAAGSVTWKDILGDTSGDTSTNIVDASNKRFLHTAMSGAVQTAIDSSSNLYITAFGVSSGVNILSTDGSMTGFPVTTGKTTVQSYTASTTYLMIAANIKLAATGAVAGLYFGDTNNGVGLEWSVGGSIDTVQYSSGTRTVIENIATITQDTSMHSYVINVYFNVGSSLNSIAGQFDSIVSPNAGKGHGATIGISSAGITVVAGGTTGKVQNLSIEYQNQDYMQYSGMAWLVNSLVPTSDANSSYIAHRTIFADQIDWLSGTPTGPVSLDSVPNGATSGKVNLADITSGHVMKTGASGTFNIKGVGDSQTLSLDTEVADGSTYIRVKGQNLLANNINTPFNTSGLYIGSDGSITNFSTGYTSTSTAYPLVAGFLLNASGWIKLAGTSGAADFIIGNSTNGLGVRWSPAGVAELVTFKAGVATAGTAIVTTTRDSNWHWVSVHLTPGATPGTSDAYVLYFDKSTITGTTGTSIVTWGSTATFSFTGGSTAGSSLLDFRLSSNNP